MTGKKRKASRSGARWAAGAISVGLHLGVPLLLLLAPVEPTPMPEPAAEPILVDLFTPPPPPPPPPAPQPAPEEAAPLDAGAASGPPTPDPPAAPPPLRLREAPPTRQVPPVPIAPSTAPPVPIAMASLSAAQLSGAARAGSGSGQSGDGIGGGNGNGSGGACDMIRRLQDALRDDDDLRVAVAQAHGGLSSSSRALLIWDGDWIQNSGQEGKGLAGLRQAIAAEVAFSPRECRTQAVRGLVLLTLADAPGAPKVALGTGLWRWNDLTGAR
ncbi:MAG: hypothetical protein IBJ02_00660 [Brevundimonas sp.]|nr:hypothetical protein [Brevundimonas sp.]